MTDHDDTTAEDLRRAVEIGRKAGLRFVYAGNLPGDVGNLENTYCPDCRELLVERRGYHILHYCITKEGNCPSCLHAIPGRWAEAFHPRIASRPFSPRFYPA